MAASTRKSREYREKAAIVKSLAHPTRLLFIDELSRGEQCVCDLRDRVGAHVSTVSKHLSILKSSGLVEDEKRGQQVYYKLRCPCITQFFDCIAAMAKETKGAR